MYSMITHPDQSAHVSPDADARQRTDRLAKATIEEMQDALAFLSVIDPEAFNIAFTAVTPATGDQHEDDEPVPVCRACGSVVGIFPEHGLAWQHYTGDGMTSGGQQIFDPGHAPQVIWCLPDEDPALV
jgi:hypothetical protein